MGTDSHFAAQELRLGDVAYGSLGDIVLAKRQVRYTAKSGPQSEAPSRQLSANRRRRPPDRTLSQSVLHPSDTG
jgi:hypothetical protein